MEASSVEFEVLAATPATSTAQSSNWQDGLENAWLDLELPQFLKEIGVDFEAAFLAPLRASTLETNPYSEHYWTFFRLDRLPPGVFHASPQNQVSQNTPAIWEEWFIEDGVLHHHVMRNHAEIPANKPAALELINWRSPNNDIEHPLEVLDIDWYYFNDAELTPYLLRK